MTCIFETVSNRTKDLRTTVILIFAGYFLFGSLFPYNKVGELAKLSSLLDHYQQHKTNDEAGTNFLKFLWMHYTMGSQHDSAGNHTNLPFHHFSADFAFFLPVPAQKYIYQQSLTKEQNSLYRISYNYLFSFSFFQPPRL